MTGALPCGCVSGGLLDEPILGPVPGPLTVPELQLPAPRRVAVIAAVTVTALLAATIVVATLEGPQIAIGDASPVYLIAVLLVGSFLGTWPGLVTAVASFLVYDALFTEPRLSLVVTDPRRVARPRPLPVPRPRRRATLGAGLRTCRRSLPPGGRGDAPCSRSAGPSRRPPMSTPPRRRSRLDS